jgi:cis-3-alkyl-4-acyloxetan-2-one decarboxylase
MVTPGNDLPDWLRRLYPFRPQTFRTPGGAGLSFVDEGPRRDEAVVLLHGNPTWSFFFRDLIARLAPTHRCIAPDHVGMGLSEKPEHYPYTLARRIADIEALIDHLGLRRIHLVVHDWGGAIGCGVAVRNPQRIGRVVVLNTAAFLSQRIPGRIAVCRTGFPGTLLVRGLNGFAWPATRMAMSRRRLTADERRGYLYPYRTWNDRVAVDAFVKDIPLDAAHPTRATLQAIEDGLPTLRRHTVSIVWGGRDFCFDDTFLARWREFLPEATVLRLADVGHYVLDDGGEEAIAACVRGLG